jgi:hydrogenase/urease accessory protein HupE|nr:MAG TPA: hypothetical protein [Inoviridae sp.]
MILEAIISVFCTMLDGLLSGLSFVQIPTQGIQVLATVTGYGSYVVGADLLLCFASVVATWAVFKMVVGIGLFVWRLLPLT